MNNELDAVRALPAKWRERADECALSAVADDHVSWLGKEAAHHQDADELEAALSTQPAPSSPEVDPRMASMMEHGMASWCVTPESEQVAASVAVPEGWRLVPEKITTEMWKAWELSFCDSGSYQEDYAAMLAAAPAAPETGGENGHVE